MTDNLCITCRKYPINSARSKIRCDGCLDKISQSVKKAKINHPDRVLEYQKSYYKNNKDKIYKKSREYIKSHPDKKKQYSKKYNDKPEIKLKYAEYQKSRLDIHRKHSKKYYDTHPEVVKISKHKTYLLRKDKAFQENNRRRAKVNQAEGSFTKKEWTSLLETYGGKCLSCGSNIKMEADHVIPISRGGSNSIDNIQPLCLKCNRSKGVKTLDFRPFGRAILDWT